jgi:hypothetical protein
LLVAELELVHQEPQRPPDAEPTAIGSPEAPASAATGPRRTVSAPMSVRATARAREMTSSVVAAPPSHCCMHCFRLSLAGAVRTQRALAVGKYRTAPEA